ncbi:MAG: pilin [Patescibacteria group bacterium]|jgi:predicted transporter
MRSLKTLGLSLTIVALSAAPAFAQSADVSKVQNFLTNIIQVLVTLAGLLAAVFFVLGGIGYITSSGAPEKLDQSKRTLVYSAIGLAVCVGAFVLTGVVSDLANAAFN